MATVSKYQTASGATLYRVRYRTPSGRQTDRRGFATKRDAERYAASVEVAKMRGEYVAPALGWITVGELGRRGWRVRADTSSRPATGRWRSSGGCGWLRGGVTSLSATSGEPAIQRWLADLSHGVHGAKPVGASVVNRAHHVLSAILGDAVRDRLLVANPASDIRLPRKNRKRPVYLTHAQVAALANAAGEYEPLVLLLAYTGLRWGEAIGLRVRDLDMLRRRAAVCENAVQVGQRFSWAPRRRTSSAAFRCPSSCWATWLASARARAATICCFPATMAGTKNDRTPRVGWFIKAVAESGVPRVTPRDLRHSAASLAVSAGANVKAVQRMLGHASAAMTLDVYADLFDDDLEAVATALNDARARESVGKMWAQGGQPTQS